MQILSSYLWIPLGYTRPEECLIRELGIHHVHAQLFCDEARLLHGMKDKGLRVLYGDREVIHSLNNEDDETE